MPDLRFAAPKEDRVAVITGGARGIGRACALRLAEEGRHVVVADLLEEESVDVVEAVESLGRRAVAVTTDVTDESAVRAAVAETIERFGRLDIL